MAKKHVMTPARRAALKKAQAASARKRRGKGKGKLAAANRKLSAKSRFKRSLVSGAVSASFVLAAHAYGNYAASRDYNKTSKSKVVTSNASPQKGLKMSNRYFFAPHTNRGKLAKKKYG